MACFWLRSDGCAEHTNAPTQARKAFGVRSWLAFVASELVANATQEKNPQLRGRAPDAGIVPRFSDLKSLLKLRRLYLDLLGFRTALERTIAGTEDLSLVRAEGKRELHQRFVNTWVPYCSARWALDPAWSYRLFPWDRIAASGVFGSVVAAIDQDGTLEGMLAMTASSPIFKVDFVSAAPWNSGEGRARRGVGTALLAVAIEASIAAGFNGELALSSTPESEPFYERLQFSRTGDRDHEGLAVFRLSSTRAKAHLHAYPPIAWHPSEKEGKSE